MANMFQGFGIILAKTHKNETTLYQWGSMLGFLRSSVLRRRAEVNKMANMRFGLGGMCV